MAKANTQKDVQKTNAQTGKTQDVKALFEKFNGEVVAKAGRKTDKAYNAGDIREAVKGLFAEVEVEEMPMAVVVRMLKATDGRFSEMKYQEVRACVKGKKFAEVTLETSEAGVSVVRMV